MPGACSSDQLKPATSRKLTGEGGSAYGENESGLVMPRHGICIVYSIRGSCVQELRAASQMDQADPASLTGGETIHCSAPAALTC